MRPVLVLVTCPSTEIAEKIAQEVVQDRLAACAQVGPSVKSFYRWKGQLNADSEVRLSIKTQESRFKALCTKIRQLHPFEIPQIISIPISSGLEEYLDWLNQQTE